MKDKKPSARITNTRYTVTWERDGITHVAYRSIEKSAHEFKAKLREAGVDVVCIQSHTPAALSQDAKTTDET